MSYLPKRIALVYDRVNKWGGAERVLLALHDLFPSAPLYTSVYDEIGGSWAKVFPQVLPTFLNRIPLAKNHHELIPFLTPIAFETFDFTDFDIVISVTSADAKGIVTKPSTFHLCYCLTPTRYLWSHNEEYIKQLGPVLGLLSRPSFNYLKYWDKIASRRPDAYISISNTVRDRVQQYYGFDSRVVYPPVDVQRFSNIQHPTSSNYFLWLGRLVPYKRPDLVIRAFNQTGKRLVMIGTGSMESYLRSIAGPNVELKGFVPDTEIPRFIQNCKALIFYHEEDFGITPIEAMAAGKPVIALNKGGTGETVVNHVTGILSEDSSLESLVKVLENYDSFRFNTQLIKKQAEKFSHERFAREFVKVLSYEWQKYKTTFMF